MIAKTQTLQIQQISTDYHCEHQGPEARSLQKIKKFMRHINYPDGSVGKFQNSELGGRTALESPDDGRRTTGAPDDGRHTTDDGRRTTGSPDLYGERFRGERERCSGEI